MSFSDLRRSVQEGRRTETGLPQALAWLTLVRIFRGKESSEGQLLNSIFFIAVISSVEGLE